MAWREGYWRLRLVGIAILAAGVVLELAIVGRYAVAFFSGVPAPFFLPEFLGFPPMILGIAIVLGVWVADGFAAQSGSGAEPPPRERGEASAAPPLN